MSKEELNVCPRWYYTSSRKKDGTYYKSSSKKSIRAAIDRFLRSPPHTKSFPMISDPAFTETNKVFNDFVKDFRKKGKIAGIGQKCNIESLRAGNSDPSGRELGSCTVTEYCLV